QQWKIRLMAFLVAALVVLGGLVAHSDNAYAGGGLLPPTGSRRLSESPSSVPDFVDLTLVPHGMSPSPEFLRHSISCHKTNLAQSPARENEIDLLFLVDPTPESLCHEFHCRRRKSWYTPKCRFDKEHSPAVHSCAYWRVPGPGLHS